jgi:hypothetical protein
MMMYITILIAIIINLAISMPNGSPRCVRGPDIPVEMFDSTVTPSLDLTGSVNSGNLPTEYTPCGVHEFRIAPGETYKGYLATVYPLTGTKTVGTWSNAPSGFKSIQSNACMTHSSPDEKTQEVVGTWTAPDTNEDLELHIFVVEYRNSLTDGKWGYIKVSLPAGESNCTTDTTVVTTAVTTTENNTQTTGPTVPVTTPETFSNPNTFTSSRSTTTTQSGTTSVTASTTKSTTTTSTNTVTTQTTSSNTGQPDTDGSSLTIPMLVVLLVLSQCL